MISRSWGASFDCHAKQLTDIEKHICADTTLSDLDFKLGYLYFRVKNNSPLSDRSTITDGQRQWIARRSECRDNQCLLAAYMSRLAELASAETSLFGGASSQSDERRDIATPVAYFQETYDGLVGAMAFSADDERLAIVPAGVGDDLHVWEWRDHPHLAMKLDWPSRYPGRMGTLNTIAYSSDGKLLAFAHDSSKRDGAIKTVRIYNAKTGVLVHEIVEPAAANPTAALGFSLDGKSLVQLHPGQSGGSELVVYRTDDWTRAAGPLKYPFTAHSMALNSEGDLIAVGGGRWQPDLQSQIVIIDLASLTLRTVIDAPFKDGNFVSSVCWSPDGRTVIAGTSWLSGSDPDTIKVFDSKSGAQLPGATTDSSSATQLAFTPNGKYLIVGSLREARILDVEHKRVLQKLVMTRGPLNIPIALSHDGQYLATGAANNVTIWKLQ
jgi:uncharacterized protein